MADNGYDTLTLVGRHVPEPMVNAAGNPASPQELGHDTINPVTGMYEVGALIDGAFVVIFSEKASLVFDQIDLAKQNQSQESSEPAAPPAQETPETGPLSDQTPPSGS